MVDLFIHKVKKILICKKRTINEGETIIRDIKIIYEETKDSEREVLISTFSIRKKDLIIEVEE